MRIFHYFATLFLHVCQVQRDAKIDKLSRVAYIEQAVEILTALKKLGDDLLPEEEALFRSHATNSLQQFEIVTSDMIGELDECVRGRIFCGLADFEISILIGVV